MWNFTFEALSGLVHQWIVENSVSNSTYLKNREHSSDHHEQIRFLRERIQMSGNDAEDSISEEPEGGNAQQDIIEITLFFSFELEMLYPVRRHVHSLCVQVCDMNDGWRSEREIP